MAKGSSFGAGEAIGVLLGVVLIGGLAATPFYVSHLRSPKAALDLAVEDDLEAVRSAYAVAGLEATVVPFIEDMASAYAATDLLVCRAGATTIAELSAASDDALSKATWEGIPDRHEVIEWTDRAKSLLLAQRERSSLRSEVPSLAERLLRLLRSISLPQGIDGEAAVARFLARLAETALARD